MDSILNTSWAFIQGLGYKITDYYTGYLEHINGKQDAHAYDLPKTFTKAFMDITSYKDGSYAWTLRPILLDVSSNNYFLYSTWAVNVRARAELPLILPLPSLDNGATPMGILPHTWSLTGTKFYIHSTSSSSQTTTVVIYIYYIE